MSNAHAGRVVTISKQSPITIELVLNGEVTPNRDRMAQVLPRSAGVAREVLKGLGDRVGANELLAVVESRELAEAEAAYLTARSKLELAERQLSREEALWKNRNTLERAYLTAKEAANQAGFELKSAERKLVLLGMDPKSAADNAAGLRASIPVGVVAPFEGTIIEKRVTLGEQVSDQKLLLNEPAPRESVARACI